MPLKIVLTNEINANNIANNHLLLVMAEQISNLFTNKTEIRHEGGHYIPSRKDNYKDFIMEMLANKTLNC